MIRGLGKMDLLMMVCYILLLLCYGVDFVGLGYWLL